MIIDLKGNIDNCKGQCNGLFNIWEDWVNSNRSFGGILQLEPTIKHKFKPALVKIPNFHSEYLKEIGCKSRNMLNKCQKNDCFSHLIDPNNYLIDIYKINTSKLVRQGKPMNSRYLKEMLRIKPEIGCNIHKEKWFGILKENKLVAYCNLHIMNELAIINKILGHGDYLKYGIMNELINSMVVYCIGTQVKYLNYLTIKACLPGLKLFKHSVGFKEEEIEFVI
jgi:hypothetical protein